MVDSLYRTSVNDFLRRHVPGRGLLAGVLLLLMIVVGLSACGKKPGSVDAPPGTPDTFPQVYPDLSTDPPP